MALDITKPVELTAVHIKRIFGGSDQFAADWHAAIKPACDERSITTVGRLAAFLANLKVESASLTVLTENLNYSSSRLQVVFPKYFPTKALADQYANKPEMIANRVYGGRLGNGPEASGDGYRYRGRGAIQLTGKANYEAATRGGVSCLGDNANYLTTKAGAIRSATWFWNSKGLNAPADQAQFETVCRRINGGSNGLAERKTAYNLALVVLSALPDGTVVNADPADPGTGGENQIEVEPKDPSAISNKDAKHQTIQEPIAAGKAQYPYNQVFESRSGHLIEIDDTPSAERLHWYHRVGTYMEMQPDGTFSAKTMKDHYLFVNGDSFRDVKGDETINITGQSYEKVGEKVIESQGDITAKANTIQLDAPIVNAQEVCNLPIVNVQMITMKPGSKSSGRVADLKARDADHADFAEGAKWAMRAGGLGPGKATPKPGSQISGSWSDLHDSVWTGNVEYVNVGTTDGTSFVGFRNDVYEDVYIESIGNTISTSVGDVVTNVNGDRLTQSGGDVVEHCLGEMEIASGEPMKLISDTSITINAPQVNIPNLKMAPVKSLMFEPITGVSDLEAPSSQNNGMVAVFIDMAGLMKVAKSNGSTWTLIAQGAPV